MRVVLPNLLDTFLYNVNHVKMIKYQYLYSNLYFIPTICVLLVMRCPKKDRYETKCALLYHGMIFKMC